MSDSVRWTVRLVFQRWHASDTERTVITTDYGHSHPSRTVEEMVQDGYAAIDKRPSWEWQTVKDKGWELVMLEVWPGVGLLGAAAPPSGGQEDT